MSVTPEKTPRISAGARAQMLTNATSQLTEQVKLLTDVVEANNKRITILTSELNKKPDDIELQFITGMAARQRKDLLLASFLIAVTMSIVVDATVHFFF